MHEAWFDRLKSLEDGEAANPRGLATHEELDARLEFDAEWNILDVPARKLNYRFMVAEWLWMSFGRNDLATLAQYNSQMSRFSDDGLTLTGAYGPHIVAHKDWVLDRLRRDPMTRQAVLEIKRPYLEHTKDEPCTLSLQFLCRDGELHCIANMRSSDVWLGVPYDAFAFSQIQNALTGELGVNRGWTSIRMGSSHLYEVNAPAAQELLEERYFEDDNHDTIRSPALPGWPPAWLEHVLVHRRLPFYPEIIDRPWINYARVLVASTSAEALAILKEMS